MTQDARTPLQVPDVRVLDAAAAAHPTVAAFVEHWRSLAAGSTPERRAFDFMKIYRIAPHLLMAERIAPGTYKFIYCGTTVADNFPRDLTGMTFGPAAPCTSRVDWPGFFTTVLDGPIVRFGRVRIDWPNGEHRDIIYGACPLLGRDNAPAFVVACLVFLERPPFELRES